MLLLLVDAAGVDQVGLLTLPAVLTQLCTGVEVLVLETVLTPPAAGVLQLHKEKLQLLLMKGRKLQKPVM